VVIFSTLDSEVRAAYLGCESDRPVGREASMTEAEWLACEDPQPMLGFLRDKASDS
jgi:hypothetical protein